MLSYQTWVQNWIRAMKWVVIPNPLNSFGQSWIENLGLKRRLEKKMGVACLDVVFHMFYFKKVCTDVEDLWMAWSRSWWTEIEFVGSKSLWFLFLWWSFCNPTWLPWCQRHGSFPWIHSHWNIEQHLNLRSVVLADKNEHSNNPTMSGGSSSYAAALTWQTHHEVQVLPNIFIMKSNETM